MNWNPFAGKKPAASPGQPPTPHSNVSSAPRAYDRVILPASAGVTWGQSYDSVMQHIRAQQWSIVTNNSNDINVFVQDVDIDGHPGSMLAFRFYKGELFGLTIGYHDIPESRALDEYNMVKIGLTGKYGPPPDDNHWFEAPYTEGDGREAEAIRAGKVHFSAVWYFDDNRHGIMLKLNSYMHIMIKYEDSEVAEIANPS